MKNTSKFLPKGTLFSLTADFWVIRPGQPTRHYPAGTHTTIVGHKRQRSDRKEMVYTLRLPDGHTRELSTATIHQAIAPHLSQDLDEKVQVFGGEGCPLRTRTGKFLHNLYR